MGGMEVVGLGMVNMMMVDRRVTVAEVVELAEVELEAVGLVVRVVGESCLREVEVVEENYLMKVEVIAEGYLLDDPTRFDVYHRLGYNHQVRGKIFLSFWTTNSMVDSRVLSLPSKVSIFVDTFGCSSSFLAIVGAFPDALIPLDADKEAKKTSDVG